MIFAINTQKLEKTEKLINSQNNSLLKLDNYKYRKKCAVVLSILVCVLLAYAFFANTVSFVFRIMIVFIAVAVFMLVSELITSAPNRSPVMWTADTYLEITGNKLFCRKKIPREASLLDDATGNNYIIEADLVDLNSPLEIQFISSKNILQIKGKMIKKMELGDVAFNSVNINTEKNAEEVWKEDAETSWKEDYLYVYDIFNPPLKSELLKYDAQITGL